MQFKRVTTRDWESQIAKDLKGKPLEEAIYWEVEEGLNQKAFFTAEDQRPNSAAHIENRSLNLNEISYGPRHWKNVPQLIVSDAQEANKEGLKLLNGGADGLLFRLETKLEEDFFPTLLRGILLPYCSTHFECVHLPVKEVASRLDHYIQSLKTDERPSDCTLYSINDSPKTQVVSYMRQVVGIIDCNSSFTEQVANLLEFIVKLAESKALNQLATINVWGQNEYFLQIAQLRAIKLLVGKLCVWLANKGIVSGATDVKTHFFTTVTVNGETKEDPYLNMLSNTNQTMAGILGGCDYLTVLPHTNGIEEADGFSRRIAKNISIILKEESYFDKVADPVAGSYYIEQLTDKLAELAWENFTKGRPA